MKKITTILLFLALVALIAASCSTQKEFRYKPKKEGCGDKLKLPKRFTA